VVGVDVDEDGHGAAQEHGVAGRGPRHRGHDRPRRPGRRPLRRGPRGRAPVRARQSNHLGHRLAHGSSRGQRGGRTSCARSVAVSNRWPRLPRSARPPSARPPCSRSCSRSSRNRSPRPRSMPPRPRSMPPRPRREPRASRRPPQRTCPQQSRARRAGLPSSLLRKSCSAAARDGRPARCRPRGSSPSRGGRTCCSVEAPRGRSAWGPRWPCGSITSRTWFLRSWVEGRHFFDPQGTTDIAAGIDVDLQVLAIPFVALYVELFRRTRSN
jgi:hypothetical protein